MMIRNRLSKYNWNIMQYFESIPASNRSSVFIFASLIVFFIAIQIFFSRSRSTPTVIVIHGNNSLVSKLESPHNYLYNFQHKLAPDYADKIIDKAQPPATCLMIVRAFDGAFGNRMFVFASAYGLARLHQCDLYVAPYIIASLQAIFVVNITNTPVHLVTNDSVLKRPGIFSRYSGCVFYDDLMRVPLSPNYTNYELAGFYQAYGYFYKYKDEISYLFQFHRGVIQKVVPLVEQLVKTVWNISLDLGNYTKDNVTFQYLKSVLTRPPASLLPVTWVGIHIRRGDFLTFFRIETSIEYLDFAMNYYRRKYMNCRFLIASDDKAYVKTNLGHNLDVLITPDNFFAGDDLGALALCEHTIVTAGTYGWWAAWLAGGDVVHDLNYPVSWQICIREHYFPPWFVFPHNSSSRRAK